MKRKIPLPYTGKEGAVTSCPACDNDDIVYSVRQTSFRCSNPDCNHIYNPFTNQTY